MFETNACRDAPDDRDILYGAVSEEKITAPERYYMVTPYIYNQGERLDTKMACGSYQMIHGVNTMNYVRTQGEQRDPYPYWLEFVEENKTPTYDPIKKGSSLQAQLGKARKDKLIEGYVKIDKTSKEEYISNLVQKRVIYTGSSQIDRKKTRDSKDKYAVIGKGAAHIVTITGYGKKGLVCLNSYGPTYMDGGYFYIHRADVEALFSCYALIDYTDYRTMEQWKEAWKKHSESKQPKDRFASIRGKYN